MISLLYQRQYDNGLKLYSCHASEYLYFQESQMRTFCSDLLYDFYCNGLCLLVPQKCPLSLIHIIHITLSGCYYYYPHQHPLHHHHVHFLAIDSRESLLLTLIIAGASYFFIICSFSIPHSLFYLASTGTSLIQIC